MFKTTILKYTPYVPEGERTYKHIRKQKRNNNKNKFLEMKIALNRVTGKLGTTGKKISELEEDRIIEATQNENRGGKRLKIKWMYEASSRLTHW